MEKILKVEKLCKNNERKEQKRKITEVSGGQLQRACICRSMINQPEIICADEPTGALNKSASEGFFAGCLISLIDTKID